MPVENRPSDILGNLQCFSYLRKSHLRMMGGIGYNDRALGQDVLEYIGQRITSKSHSNHNMNLTLKKGLFLLGGSLLWAAGIWWGIRTVPVGVRFLPGQKGEVTAVAVYPDGHVVESPRKVVDEQGGVSFGIDRAARSFYFRLYSGGDDGRKKWQLKDIRFCGFPAVQSTLIPKFEMQRKLFSEPPSRDDEPLCLEAEAGDPLGLPNVFPYVLHVIVSVQALIAVIPLFLLGVILAVVFFRCRAGKALIAVLNRDVVFFFLVAAIVLLTLPAPVTPAVPGLDSSWIWLMNRFAGEPVFGKDFVFTYGPLGFLIAPQGWGMNIAFGMVTNIFFSLLFGWIVLSLHRCRHLPSCSTMSFLLLFLWMLPWPNGMEWKWCMTSVTACALAVFVDGIGKRTRMCLLGLAAVTAVLQSFVKFSSCITVVGQQLFLLAYGLCRERRRMVAGICVYMGTSVCFAAILAVFLFPSFSSFVEWIRGSMEIASGYNLVMGGDKSLPEFASMFILLGVFVVFVIIGGKERRQALAYWFAFLPFLFCAYKYAVVRQSGLPLALGIAWFSVMQIIVIPHRTRRSVVMVFAFVSFAIALGVVWLNERPHLGVSFGNLLANVCPGRTMDRVSVESHDQCDAVRLPQAWRDKIGTNRVMIAGWEMGPAMSGDLNLVPFPATQTYSAYTPYLDQCCADRVVRADDAVKFILVPANPWSFDSRNIYFDNPRLWDAVRRHFRFAAEGKEHVLLERRLEPLPARATNVTFALKRPLTDKLRSLLFRPERAMAYFTFENGRQYACFANLEILDGTPFPQFLPTTSEEVSAFFDDAKTAVPLVKSAEVVISGRTLFSYNR